MVARVFILIAGAALACYCCYELGRRAPAHQAAQAAQVATHALPAKYVHNDTRTTAYVLKLLDESRCANEWQRCDAQRGQHADGAYFARTAGACTWCVHGAHMFPRLVAAYKPATVAEVGTCTGRSTAHTMSSAHAPRAYTAIDRWSARTCQPGCGCMQPLQRWARRESRLELLRGDSGKVAGRLRRGNRSFDMVLLDAGHAESDVVRDILAYWPLVRDGGVLAGHDMAHRNNFLRARPNGTAERLAYGVASAVFRLLGHCVVHSKHNTFWVEKRAAEGCGSELVK